MPNTAPASGQSTAQFERGMNPLGIAFSLERVWTSLRKNLLVSANYPDEHWREARKIIWRDRGELIAELDNLKACLRHAAKGGFRSATLAFNIRASVNLVLALLRINKVPRERRYIMIRRALFGEDTWRFAAMLGTFTGLYKFLINALPILFPSMNPRVEELTKTDVIANGSTLKSPMKTMEVKISQQKAQSSQSPHAQLVFLRKKTRRWHAALAGGIASGLAIIWEKRSRRGTIAQQLFVRGLQGSYNSFTTKHNIHIPYGDVLVFSLACGQIMYAFFLRPDTLPRSYRNWISEAAKDVIPPESIRMNLSLTRKGTFDVQDLDRILARSDITYGNRTDLQNLRELFFPSSSSSPLSIDPSVYLPKCCPCSAVHPSSTSCISVPFDRFFTVFKLMLPIYILIHFAPAVLFKWQRFKQDPRKVLAKAGFGSMRSPAFLGVFVVIYQCLFCYKYHLHRFLTELKRPPSSGFNPLAKISQHTIDLLVSKISFWVLGCVSGLSLLVEEKQRRGELAMYVLPKALESLWISARGKGLVFKTGKWGEAVLAMIGMSMVMSTYQNDPQHLSELVRRILYQFIGPN